MGACSSQSRNHNKPLIRLVKIKMEDTQTIKECDQILKQWRKISVLIQKMKTTSQISDNVKESQNEINKFCSLNRNQKTMKYVTQFFQLYEKFQYFLTEEMNQNAQNWTNYQDLFTNLDILSETFRHLGLASKGFTQSLTKY